MFPAARSGTYQNVRSNQSKTFLNNPAMVMEAFVRSRAPAVEKIGELVMGS